METNLLVLKPTIDRVLQPRKARREISGRVVNEGKFRIEFRVFSRDLIDVDNKVQREKAEAHGELMRILNEVLSKSEAAVLDIGEWETHDEGFGAILYRREMKVSTKT